MNWMKKYYLFLYYFYKNTICWLINACKFHKIWNKTEEKLAAHPNTFIIRRTE